MQAIKTKYVPASNTKPSRIKAIAEAGSVTLSWDSELNDDYNHIKAAKQLAVKYGWTGHYVGGSFIGEMYFVRAASEKAEKPQYCDFTVSRDNETQK